MGLTYVPTQDKLAHHFHRPMLGTMTHRMNSKTIPAEHESVFDKEVGLLALKGNSIGLPVYRLFSKKEGYSQIPLGRQEESF